MMKNILDKFNNNIKQIQEQLDTDFPTRYTLSIAKAREIYGESLFVTLKISDALTKTSTTIADHFYKFAGKYMFCKFWNGINAFVLETQKEKIK